MLDLDIQPEIKNKEILSVLPDSSVPEPEITTRELAFVDFSSQESVAAFINWAIRRSQLSKNEIARRMGISKTAFAAYHKAKRGRNIGIRWIVRFLTVLGGRMFVEVPLGMPKPRGKGIINKKWKLEDGSAGNNS